MAIIRVMITKTRIQKSRNGETVLARLIREQGRLKGWVADQMGVSVYRLSRLLTGEREMTLKEAAKAAEVFEVPVEAFLLEGAGSREQGEA